MTNPVVQTIFKLKPDNYPAAIHAQHIPDTSHQDQHAFAYKKGNDGLGALLLQRASFKQGSSREIGSGPVGGHFEKRTRDVSP